MPVVYEIVNLLVVPKLYAGKAFLYTALYNSFIVSKTDDIAFSTCLSVKFMYSLGWTNLLRKSMLCLSC